MTTETLAGVKVRALRSLIPPKKQKLSDWIESNIVLPDGVSALPGPVRLWPFQREIADAIGDPSVERVTLVKPVRVGFTTLLTGAMANFVANDPAPILCLLPTENDCRGYVTDDVEPIFNASPNLSRLLDYDFDETGRSTLLSRKFSGGSLKVVAAKAPRNLRRHNVRVLFMDEVDGMENTPEGSPLLLAEKRTLSFADRKIVLGSTPVHETTSHVLRSYALSDMRVLKVPCPECGGFHEMKWTDIHWPEDKPDLAYYVCPSCGSIIDERHKIGMVEGAKFFQERPAVHGHVGFRLNALVSPLANARWGRLATEFLASKDDPTLLQTFVNTILAEGWKEEGEELDEQALAARAEGFGLEVMPTEVLMITAGVDVQHDRLEITFVGWGRDGTIYILGHSVIHGQWDDDGTWAELDVTLSTKWAHPLGGKIGVASALIDSGDGITMERVYSYCFPRARRLILAGKGMAGPRKWLEASKSKIKGGKLWIVGVDGLKTAIFGRVRHNKTVRFSSDLEPVWFDQFASERAIIRYQKGQPTRRFERITGKRAEALDCVVYAFAARQVLLDQWDQRTEALKVVDALPKNKKSFAEIAAQLNR